MTRFEPLKNRHLGERCVLVANGPSLNAMDLSFLKREITFGMNKIYLGLRKFGFYPKYYCAINDKVLNQASPEIAQLNCVKFLSSRIKGTLDEDALTFHINTQTPYARFCTDISRGVHEGWTVTYAALQVAYFLGFHEVIVIGLDHRYDYMGAPNSESILDGPDVNHFAPDYFGFGQSWDNPDLKNSEESYRIAKSQFEANGRKIIDASVNGACTIFPKIDYRDVFALPK